MNALTEYSIKLYELIDLNLNGFGTHPIRKGADIFVATGCTVSPIMSSIFLHANWTLGGVKDRYI